MQSANNLKQIALALREYHDKHGRLPPAVVRSRDGQPLYSWRVLILPYLEEENLYREFKLDEPWDSPHNKPLLARMPRVFAPPQVEDLKVEPGTTFYQGFVGKGTAFELEQGARMPDDFPDGTAHTILVIEAGEAVPWTKPVDILYQPDQPLLPLGGIFTSEGRFSLFGSNRKKGFNTLFVDGSVRFLPSQISDATLRGLITRNGREKLELDW